MSLWLISALRRRWKLVLIDGLCSDGSLIISNKVKINAETKCVVLTRPMGSTSSRLLSSLTCDIKSSTHTQEPHLLYIPPALRWYSQVHQSVTVTQHWPRPPHRPPSHLHTISTRVFVFLCVLLCVLASRQVCFCGSGGFLGTFQFVFWASCLPRWLLGVWSRCFLNTECKKRKWIKFSFDLTRFIQRGEGAEKQQTWQPHRNHNAHWHASQQEKISVVCQWSSLKKHSIVRS